MTQFAQRSVRAMAWAMAISAVAGVIGCASGSGARSSAKDPHGHPPVMSAASARGLTVLDGATGAGIGWSGLMDRVRGADVVIIGEVHGHAVGGAASVALFEDVLAESGATAALSLEFFDRDTQASVDDYLTGITDEAGFREATDRGPGNYPWAHHAMVELAKAAGRPVIASNAPRRYATVARKDGYARVRDLTFSQQQLVTAPAAEIEGAYKDRFFELMEGMGASHGAPAGHGDAEMDPEAERKLVEGFYRAQNVWDATMAASIVAASGVGDHPVVHVVGQFHSDFDGGLVQRVRAAMPGARVVTVSLVNAPAWRDEDRGRADVVVMVGSDQ